MGLGADPVLAGGAPFPGGFVSLAAPCGLRGAGTDSGSGLTEGASLAHASPLVNQTRDTRLHSIAYALIRAGLIDDLRFFL